MCFILLCKDTNNILYIIMLYIIVWIIYNCCIRFLIPLILISLIWMNEIHLESQMWLQKYNLKLYMQLIYHKLLTTFNVKTELIIKYVRAKILFMEWFKLLFRDKAITLAKSAIKIIRFLKCLLLFNNSRRARIWMFNFIVKVYHFQEVDDFLK